MYELSLLHTPKHVSVSLSISFSRFLPLSRSLSLALPFLPSLSLPRLFFTLFVSRFSLLSFQSISHAHRRTHPRTHAQLTNPHLCIYVFVFVCVFACIHTYITDNSQGQIARTSCSSYQSG